MGLHARCFTSPNVRACVYLSHCSVVKSVPSLVLNGVSFVLPPHARWLESEKKSMDEKHKKYTAP